MSNTIYEGLSQKITLKMTEESDRFVFSTISDWLLRDYDYFTLKKDDLLCIHWWFDIDARTNINKN